MEPISTAISLVLSKIVLDKFYEGVSSKLGEKVVERALAPIERLGQLVWEKCFKGKSGTTELLTAAADGGQDELTKVKDYLLRALEKEEFATLVKPIAQEIHQMVVQFDDVNAENVLQVNGGQGLQVNGGQGLQVNAAQEQPIIQIQGNPTLNFGKSSG